MKEQDLPKVRAIAFIVRDGNKVLVERRSQMAKTDPGIIAIPGGHVEEKESLEDACRRELREELGVTCDSPIFLCVKRHVTPVEEQAVHYFLCDGWRGKPICNEAEEIFWLGSDELDKLDFEIDREAARKCFNEHPSQS